MNKNKPEQIFPANKVSRIIQTPAKICPDIF